MKKIKPLLPSEREKKRYLVLEYQCNKELSFYEIEKAIKNTIKNYIGMIGAAGAGTIFLKNTFNQKKRRFIIRVNRKYVDEIRASLLFLRAVNGEKILIRSIFCSGSLKKAKKKLNNTMKYPSKVNET